MRCERTEITLSYVPVSQELQVSALYGTSLGCTGTHRYPSTPPLVPGTLTTSSHWLLLFVVPRARWLPRWSDIFKVLEVMIMSGQRNVIANVPVLTLMLAADTLQCLEFLYWKTSLVEVTLLWDRCRVNVGCYLCHTGLCCWGCGECQATYWEIHSSSFPGIPQWWLGQCRQAGVTVFREDGMLF